MSRAPMLSNQHEYCWSLLPWFVTGRVSASDARSIERHLADCKACQTELEEQRALCEHVRRDDPVMLAPQASLQKLLDRIDASVPESQPDSVESVPLERERSPRHRAPRWLAIAAAIQTVAIAALLTVLWQQTSSVLNAPRFTTLTSASSGSQQPVIRVVFKPQMTTEQLQSLLTSVSGQLIGGPTEAGVYTLALDRDDKISEALGVLRGNANVLFAERVQGEAP